MYMYMYVHNIMYNYIIIIIILFNLPSHLGLPYSSRPRPHKLRIGIERYGVKGASAEVRANGTGDAVEKSLTTRMNTDEWLEGEKNFVQYGLMKN